MNLTIVPAPSHLPSSHLCRPEPSGYENEDNNDGIHGRRSLCSGDGNLDNESTNDEADVSGGQEKDGLGSEVLVDSEFQVAWAGDEEQTGRGNSGQNDEMGGEMGSGGGGGDGDIGANWVIDGDVGRDWMGIDVAMDDSEDIRESPDSQKHPAEVSTSDGAHPSFAE